MSKTFRLVAALLSSTLLFSASFAQTEKQRIDAYVNAYKNLAIDEMVRTGVPAAVTLAQGILETAGGQSDLAALANNHFGIKCKSEWTGETMSHNDDAKNECFRKYSCVKDSYADHSDFLKSRPCYAFLFKLDPTDFEGWAKGLKRAGYATNPVYAQKLIKLIVENNLQDYTLLAMNGEAKPQLLAGEGKSVGNLDGNLDGNLGEAEVTNSSNEATVQPALTMKVAEEKLKSNIYPVNSVFTINDVKVIYADAGSSLLALADNYNIGLKKLLEYNELPEEADILTASQLIFLDKKSKRGTKNIHIVETNETLRDISQKEGIQLTAILEFNGLQKGMEPAPGEKIYLQYAAPYSPRLAAGASRKTGESM